LHHISKQIEIEEKKKLANNTSSFTYYKSQFCCNPNLQPIYRLHIFLSSILHLQDHMGLHGKQIQAPRIEICWEKYLQNN